jgi:LDH2 family malate/lactate/ureidoglycolate dehydrogenase
MPRNRKLSEGIELQVLERVLQQTFAAAGFCQDEASAITKHLIWAERMGKEQYGILRIPLILKAVKGGSIRADAPVTYREMKGRNIAWIDGGGGAGHYVARFATNLAVLIAKRSGISLVLVRNSTLHLRFTQFRKDI